jgi:hypothetical protein
MPPSGGFFVARVPRGHLVAARPSQRPRLSKVKIRFAPFASDSGSPMPAVKLRASTILGAFEEAQTELVGKAVVLTDGKAGTVENVWLDELHGLRLSIGDHDGKWPISTIKFAQP